MTFQSVFKKNSVKYSNKMAIRFLDKKMNHRDLSYKELYTQAMIFSGLLKAMNLQKGDRVSLLYNSSQSQILSFLGSLLCGVIPTVLPNPAVRVSGDSYKNILETVISATYPKAVLTSESLKNSLGDNFSVSLTSVNFEGKDEIKDEIKEINLDSDDLAFIQCSSGTTGNVKSVGISQGQLVKHLEILHESFRYTDGDITYSWLPLNHDMGLVGAFLLTIYSGASLVLTETMDWLINPISFFKCVDQYRCTTSFMPNFAFQYMVDSISDTEMKDLDLSSLRFLVNGSEPITYGVIESFADKFRKNYLKREVITCGYGMAENVLAVSHIAVGDGPKYIEISQNELSKGKIVLVENGVKIYSCGKPMKGGISVSILDDYGNEIEENRVGEIFLKSPTLVKEYYNTKTGNEKFINGGFLTGDLGFLHDNEVFVTGRKKDLIIVGGRNINPVDVEYLVKKTVHSSKVRIACFGKLDEKLGTEKVYIILDSIDLTYSDQLICEKKIREIVFENLNISIEKIIFRKEKIIKKTTSGKISRIGTLENVEKVGLL